MNVFDARDVSRRGVYYNLEKSPYEYKTPYGDIFKFPSQKRLDMYKRDASKEVDKVAEFLVKRGLDKALPDEILRLIFRTCYQVYYDKFMR